MRDESKSMGSRLPAVYVDAAMRNATPYDSVRGRVGLGFDSPKQGVVRLAITPEDALALVNCLLSYCALPGDTRPPGSPLSLRNTARVP